MAAFVLGTDWSHWQGTRGISKQLIQQLDQNGVCFLINKATQGAGYEDPSLERNVKRVEDECGWLAGAYHFLEGDDPEGQARHFVSSVQHRIGGFDDRMAVLDVESVPGGANPRGWDVRRFIEEFRRLQPDHPIGIYTSAGYWRGIDNPDGAGWADYLWQARWSVQGCTPDSVALPEEPPVAGFGGWVGRSKLWQWGPYRMERAGKKLSIDGNAFYGSVGELKHMVTMVEAKPEDRPRFRRGFNEAIDELMTVVAGLTIDPANPVRLAGGQAAKEAAADAIAGLRMSAGDP